MNIFSYRWWWSKFGGRPWTYILRDIWHKYESIPIVVLMTTGATITHFWGIKTVFMVLGIFLVGYIAGHLFFGKEYIENQQP